MNKRVCQQGRNAFQKVKERNSKLKRNKNTKPTATMTSFTVKFFDNHALLQLPSSNNEEQLFGLIDTGAPSTIGYKSEFSFCDINCKVTTNYGGTTTAVLSELLGHPVHYLIGNDILCNFNLHLTTSNATFYKLSDTATTLSLTSQSKVQLPIHRGLGQVPIISANVNSSPQKQQFFFDTGAKLSYIAPRFTQELDIIEQVDDFHPSIGKFKSNVFHVPIKFAANHEFVLPCGNLPSAIQAMLMLMPNVVGIIGLSLFEEYSDMLITPSKMYLW